MVMRVMRVVCVQLLADQEAKEFKRVDVGRGQEVDFKLDVDASNNPQVGMGRCGARMWCGDVVWGCVVWGCAKTNACCMFCIISGDISSDT